MGRVQRLIKQIKGYLRQIIVTILECQQDLTPPFLAVHIVYVLLAAGALGWLAIKLMYRRLVK